MYAALKASATHWMYKNSHSQSAVTNWELEYCFWFFFFQENSWNLYICRSTSVERSPAGSCEYCFTWDFEYTLDASTGKKYIWRCFEWVCGKCPGAPFLTDAYLQKQVQRRRLKPPRLVGKNIYMKCKHYYWRWMHQLSHIMNQSKLQVGVN